MLKSPEGFHSGLNLNQGKSTLWWPSKPYTEIIASYNPDKWEEDDGIKMVGALIGSETYMRASVGHNSGDAHKLFDELQILHDSYFTFSLLKSAMGQSRINLMLRTNPPLITKDIARSFDIRVANTMRMLCGGIYKKTGWRN